MDKPKKYETLQEEMKVFFAKNDNYKALLVALKHHDDWQAYHNEVIAGCEERIEFLEKRLEELANKINGVVYKSC